MSSGVVDRYRRSIPFCRSKCDRCFELYFQRCQTNRPSSTRRRSSRCLLPHESADRAMTRSIRRPKPCSQLREAARMRAEPQSPFSIASWCGLLRASRLICPSFDPSYFHARLLPPKVSHHDYSVLLGFAEVPFRNKNGQNRQRPTLVSYKEAPTTKKLARATRHAKGAAFTTPLKNTQIEAIWIRLFALGMHAWPTATCRHRRHASLTPTRFQRRDWPLLHEKLLYTYISLDTNIGL